MVTDELSDAELDAVVAGKSALPAEWKPAAKPRKTSLRASAAPAPKSEPAGCPGGVCPA